MKKGSLALARSGTDAAGSSESSARVAPKVDEIHRSVFDEERGK